MQCEQKKLKDLKRQFWSVLHVFIITGTAKRISCGVRLLFNSFAILDDFPYSFAVSLSSCYN